MKAIKKTLDKGDRIELGEVVESTVEQTKRGKVRLLAVHEGQTTEYAVLTEMFTDGDSLSVPADGQVLTVTKGSGMGNPRAWLLVPTDAYGGSA